MASPKGRLLLLLALVFAFAGCGDDNEFPSEDREEVTELYTLSLSQGHPRVKVETVRLMMLTEDPELSKLTGELRLSDDPTLRSWGLLHWAVAAPEQGLETALVATKTADKAVAMRVATGLAGRLKSPEDLGALVESMGAHEDPEVSREATKILLRRGVFGSLPPASAEKTAKTSKHPWLLGALMHSGPEASRPNVAGEVFKNAKKRTKQQKWYLMAVGYGAGVNQLKRVKEVRSDTAKLFAGFVDAAMNGAGHEDLSGARNNLATPDKELVMFTLDMLGKVNTEDSMRMVSAFKRDTRREVRLAAVYALAEHDDADYKTFNLVLRDDDPLVVAAGIEVVLRSYAKYASVLVSDLIKVPARRQNTMMALIEVHDRAHLSGDTKVLEGLSEWVAAESTRLAEMLKSDDPALRLLAAEVLAFQPDPLEGCKRAERKKSPELAYACFAEMALRPPPEGRTHEAFIREAMEEEDQTMALRLAMGTALWAGYKQAQIHAKATAVRE